MGVVLVTGVTGFVGRNLVRHLEALDPRPDIVGVGRNMDRLDELAETSARFEAVAADLTDPEAIDRIATAVGGRTVDGVVHLASRVTSPRDDVEECVELLESNGLGTIAVWRLVERLTAVTTVSSVVHASSILVYGQSSQPAVEDQSLVPTDLYGASKMAGELFAGYFSERLSVPLAVLRLGFVYGPLDGSGKVIYRFADAAARGDDLVIGSDPAVYRDYVHVDDVCRAITRLIDKPSSGRRVVNVSGGRGVTLRELAETARRAGGSIASIREVRPADAGADAFYGCIVADGARCRELLGDTIELRDGLALLMRADRE
jgi:nucleoside-diphosphate-sugar epimerase